MLRLTTLKKLFTSFRNPNYLSVFEAQELVQQPNQLRKSMIQILKQRGQMKIPQYWTQALTDDQHGYYRHHNVFSKDGDFTTSPEISSLFGEMVATWLVVFLQHPKVAAIDPNTMKINRKFRIVELGGGRGMLMQDILRSFRSYNISNNFDLSFIQVSDFNRKQQQERVQEQFKQSKTYFMFDHQNATEQKEQFIPQNQENTCRLTWYTKLQDLVKEDYDNRQAGKEVPLTLFVMNQFFDALPVTILEYTANGWRQKVIKISKENQALLQVVDSEFEPHPKLIPNAQNPQIGDRLQISPQSLLTIDLMSQVIAYSGGAILNIDYGGAGPFVDSIRAIKSHKYIPSPYFWQVPGICDLSAHVAFSALASYAQRTQGIRAFQLIPQQFFLQALGITQRVEMLKKNKKQQKIQRLQSELKRLTDPDQMGENYKVQIISLKDYGEIYPHVTFDPSMM